MSIPISTPYSLADAFALYITRHQQTAYAVARAIVTVHEDAEAVVQTAFLHAYTTLDRVRPGVHFAPWFFRIVVNTARDHVRRRKGRQEARRGIREGPGKKGPFL